MMFTGGFYGDGATDSLFMTNGSCEPLVLQPGTSLTPQFIIHCHILDCLFGLRRTESLIYARILQIKRSTVKRHCSGLLNYLIIFKENCFVLS